MCPLIEATRGISTVTALLFPLWMSSKMGLGYHLPSVNKIYYMTASVRTCFILNNMIVIRIVGMLGTYGAFYALFMSAQLVITSHHRLHQGLF